MRRWVEENGDRRQRWGTRCGVGWRKMATGGSVGEHDAALGGGKWREAAVLGNTMRQRLSVQGIERIQCEEERAVFCAFVRWDSFSAVGYGRSTDQCDVGRSG
jgi:hypothetical protein